MGPGHPVHSVALHRVPHRAPGRHPRPQGGAVREPDEDEQDPQDRALSRARGGHRPPRLCLPLRRLPALRRGLHRTASHLSLHVPVPGVPGLRLPPRHLHHYHSGDGRGGRPRDLLHPLPRELALAVAELGHRGVAGPLPVRLRDRLSGGGPPRPAHGGRRPPVHHLPEHPVHVDWVCCGHRGLLGVELVREEDFFFCQIRLSLAPPAFDNSAQLAGETHPSAHTWVT
mmetsp:Transcript_4827/g.13513  ORF Transcript_4827/g.13513 Transcript_4827/m.13513 type:complete len:228 (+) Transcript_4827:1494-2177(+)